MPSLSVRAKPHQLRILTLLAVLCFTISAVFSENEIASSGDTDFIFEAYTLFDQGNTEGALDAFDLAIEEDSNALPALLGKAMIFAERQEHEKAFYAFGEVVKAHPRNAFAWNGRGLAAFNLENFDEALNSFQKATVDQPVNGFYYESLAWTHMCRGEFEEATEEAKKATLMYNQKGESPAYPLLIAYFSYLEDGKRMSALRTLKYALKNKPAENAWPHPIFDFLANTIEDQDLISYATNKSEETEAHTYIGLRLISLGEEAQANVHFDWVAAQGDNRVFEYALARALLNRDRATAFLD